MSSLHLQFARIILRPMMTSAGGLLLPREAAKFISDNSEDVKINQTGIKETSKKIVGFMKNAKAVSAFGKESWRAQDLTPNTDDKAAVDWVFLTDLLNFSFWAENDSKKCKINYKGKTWSGYYSMCAAVNRALDEGIPITDPHYYSQITKEQVDHVFRSDTANQMPMLEERLSSMQTAGKTLVEKYDGSFVNVIAKAGKSAQKLIDVVVKDFPTFNDVTEYKGRNVAIYKRVQILVADLWACCDGKGYGELDDIDTLTMFADYRVPQALVWFNCLQYSDDLMEILKKDTMLESGDRQEVELRGCSIWAVELIVDEVHKLIRGDPDMDDSAVRRVNASTVDFFLWDYRRVHDADTQHIPFHKIRCVYY